MFVPLLGPQRLSRLAAKHSGEWRLCRKRRSYDEFYYTIYFL